MKITGLFTELRERENMAKKIRIVSDRENDDRVIKLLFHTPGGEDKISDRVRIVDGIGEYPIPNSLLDQPGTLKAQVYIYDDNDILEKSPVYSFSVKPSIDPEDAINIEDEGLESVEVILFRLDRLEEKKNVLFSEQDLTDKEAATARDNIGIRPEDRESGMTLPVGMDADGRFYTTPYDDSRVVKSVNGKTANKSGEVKLFIPSKISELTEDDSHETVTSAQKALIIGSVQQTNTTDVVAEDDDRLVSSGAVYAAVDNVYTAMLEMIGDVDSVLQKITNVIGGGVS